MLEAYLRSLVGAGSDLDDLFQETMIVAWKRINDFDKSRPFGAWLRGIARVLVLEFSRKKKARARTFDPTVLNALDARFEELDTYEGSTFRERTSGLLDCIEKLPEATRTLIELVYLRGKSLVEAAAALDQKQEAVKKRVQRGRAMLAECLGSGAER